MKKIQDVIKSCSKDEDSYKKLKELFEDIESEKQKAVNHLELLERAIRSDYDSILITTLELEKPGPQIVYVNDGFTRMTGYSREEVIGKTPRILQGPKTDRAVLDKLKQRLMEGQAFFGHTVNYRKDGTEFINQWDIHPLTNSKGEITHWVSYQHDITERKRSEKQLVDTQLAFDKLTEESKKTLVDVDEQGNILTSNKAFRDLVGFDAEELKKIKLWDLLSDHHIENFKHKFDVFKPSDFDNKSYNIELTNKNKKTVEVKANARLLSSGGQAIVRIAFENKSLQKRIISMLSNRTDHFEQAFDNAKDFSYKLVKDNSGEYLIKHVSDNFSKITGIASDEAKSMLIKKFLHDDDKKKFKDHLNIVFNGNPNTEQFRLKRKDGSFVEVIDYAKPEWDADHSSITSVKGSVSTEISSEKKGKHI
jgi:PAS domain S-box-containing protein